MNVMILVKSEHWSVFKFVTKEGKTLKEICDHMPTVSCYQIKIWTVLYHKIQHSIIGLIFYILLFSQHISCVCCQYFSHFCSPRFLDVACWFISAKTCLPHHCWVAASSYSTLLAFSCRVTIFTSLHMFGYVCVAFTFVSYVYLCMSSCHVFYT
jgi:hypothetical protein